MILILTPWISVPSIAKWKVRVWLDMVNTQEGRSCTASHPGQTLQNIVHHSPSQPAAWDSFTDQCYMEPTPCIWNKRRIQATCHLLGEKPQKFKFRIDSEDLSCSLIQILKSFNTRIWYTGAKQLLPAVAGPPKIHSLPEQDLFL